MKKKALFFFIKEKTNEINNYTTDKFEKIAKAIKAFSLCKEEQNKNRSNDIGIEYQNINILKNKDQKFNILDSGIIYKFSQIYKIHETYFRPYRISQSNLEHNENKDDDGNKITLKNQQKAILDVLCYEDRLDANKVSKDKILDRNYSYTKDQLIKMTSTNDTSGVVTQFEDKLPSKELDKTKIDIPQLLMSVDISTVVMLSNPSIRLLNCIQDAKVNRKIPIRYIEEYLNNIIDSENKFLNIRNFGKKTAQELTSILSNWKNWALQSNDINEFCARSSVNLDSFLKVINELSDLDINMSKRLESEKKIDIEISARNNYLKILSEFMFPECLNISQASTRLQNTIKIIETDIFQNDVTFDQFLINQKQWYQIFISYKNIGKNTLDEMTSLALLFIENIFLKAEISENDAKLIAKKLLNPEADCELPIIDNNNLTILKRNIVDLNHQSAEHNAEIYYDDIIKLMPNNPNGILIGFLKQNLAEKNYDIINRRFGIDRERRQTLEEIGQAYNVTRERIRQIEKKSLKTLSKKEFLGIFKIYLENKKEEIESSLVDDRNFINIDDIEYWNKNNDGLIVLAIKIVHGEISDWLDKNYETANNNGVRQGWYNPRISQESKKLLFEWLNTNTSTSSRILTRIRENLRKQNWPIQISRLLASMPDISEKGIEEILQHNFRAEIKNGTIIKIEGLSSSTRVIISLRSIGKPAHVEQIRAKHNQIFGFDMEEHAVGAILQRIEEAMIVQRGVYCLSEKFGIPQVIINELRQYCYDEISRLGHYVSAKILQRELVNKFDLQFAHLITPYSVLGICQDDARFSIRRGLMIGLAKDGFEETFTPLNEMIHTVVDTYGPISIKEIHKKISHERDVMTVGISAVLQSSPEIIMTQRGIYDKIEKAIGDDITISKLSNAIKIALIDYPVSLPILMARIAAVGMNYNSTIIFSFLKNCGFVGKDNDMFTLLHPDREIIAYNKYFHTLHEDTPDNELTFIKYKETQGSNHYDHLAAYDFRFFVQREHWENLDNTTERDNEINMLLKEFEF